MEKELKDRLEAIARRMNMPPTEGIKFIAPKIVGEVVLWMIRNGETVSFDRLISVLNDDAVRIADFPADWRRVVADVLTDAKTSARTTPQQTL